MRRIDLYELEVGDKFTEDYSPTVFLVKDVEWDYKYNCIQIVAEDLESGDYVYFSYTNEAYAPRIILLGENEK